MARESKQVAASKRGDAVSRVKKDPIKDTVPYMLQVVARLQTGDFCSRVEGLGVHPAEAYVLLELWREEPLSQTQLSNRLDIGNATVGQTLKRLERDGFVLRHRCVDDGRRLLVSLTDSGRALRAPISRATAVQKNAVTKVLGKEGAEQLLLLLSKLASHSRVK